MLLAAEWSTHAEPAVVASDRVNGDSDVGTLRNKVIGSIGVAALVAGSLIAAPIAAHGADPVTVQVLGINDFHGRIGVNGVEAGAAVLSGAVHQLRAQYPDTVFAAAGDLIGASTFESFIDKDKPTIDALNAAGLEVSAVGNHEFDRGFADLRDRVIAGSSNASWDYLGANVYLTGATTPVLPEYSIIQMADVQVAIIGAVDPENARRWSPPAGSWPRLRRSGRGRQQSRSAAV